MTRMPYSSPVLRVNNLNLRPWLVRLVRPGDRYGAEHCLVHGRPRPGRKLEFASKFDSIPMVEFYDFTNPEFGYDYAGDRGEAASVGAQPLGQFVSRYYVSTLQESPAVNGLCLQGGVSGWSVDHILMQKVMAWLERTLALPNEEQPLYTEEIDMFGQ